MAQLRLIDKSVIENPDFTNQKEDITVNINLGNEESISFIAEKEFFTPRRIATNRGDVALLENVVEYTSANIPVVKMPGLTQDITKPQYYLNSVVSDQYQDLPIDKYFLELDNDLAPPTYVGSLAEQRQIAMNTLLNLEDAAAAARAGDREAFTEAEAQVDENYAEMAGLQNMDALGPEEMLTPEEADELTAIGVLGLDTTDVDTSADVINPEPEINDSDLIRFGNKIKPLTGKTAGTDIINKAIKLLNSGIQTAENASQTGTDEEGKCKFITVAKGKKGGVFGIGAKKYETKVSREETEKKLALVKEDISAQETSQTTILQTKSGFSPLVKIQKKTLFGKLVEGIGNAGVFASIAGIVAAPFTAGASLALTAAGAAAAGTAGLAGAVAMATNTYTVPKGYTPMSKEQALAVLKKTQEELQGILAKDCE